MSLEKHYRSAEVEPQLQDFWQEKKIYQFIQDSSKKVFAIDTPPPTVSGYLHLGHVYSYTHTDIMARYKRMQGYRVYYPMGYDDNGLPTERLVEKQLGIRATEIGRQSFIKKCLQVSEEAEKDYQELWQRLGLSIDWHFTYRTIDERSRRISQWSFLDLYRKNLVYRKLAPSIWCPECQTAIAQAELNDLDRESEFVTLPFKLVHPDTTENDEIHIATTRPELLPACVAVFIHPKDERYQGLAGKQVFVPLFDQTVPILIDEAADPQIGTGAVMCCTFGDTTDVTWWHNHHLPLVEAITRDGRMTQAAGKYAGLPITIARNQIVGDLRQNGQIINRQITRQSVRVHERCDTPVEYIVSQQWFIRVLDRKKDLLQAGERIAWHPEYMKARYLNWVENLAWDWCISRQRYFGVPFPLWYCRDCGKVMLAEEDHLPVDPSVDQPRLACSCGSRNFIPEDDILDTWATSSMTPQIVGQWGSNGDIYQQIFPFSMRPQAHEIIRTWAFYTLVKSTYHFGQLPWDHVAISGWGIAGEGMKKISKSRGGGPMPPLEMIERYSADAVRYWAASTGPGKDAIISEEKIRVGSKLVTKLWNLARFSERFFLSPEEFSLMQDHNFTDHTSPADRWILSQLQILVREVNSAFEAYDYATAKSEIESFFWKELTDNYLEMCKQRLYNSASLTHTGARWTLSKVLITILKLWAPFLPYVTEAIYQQLFKDEKDTQPTGNASRGQSIHLSSWPTPELVLEDETANKYGGYLLVIATAVRRYKSEHNLSLNMELPSLQLATTDPGLTQFLIESTDDLTSITRTRFIEVGELIESDTNVLQKDDMLVIACKGEQK